MRVLTFEEYLCGMKHSARTIKSYCYTVNNFLVTCPQAEQFGYKDIVAYVNKKVSDCKNTKTVVAMLAGIKKYYDFLIETGKRDNHPCRTLYLKSAGRNRDVIHADLFSSAELDPLLQREERYAALKLRNQALISLLIYQGLAPHELTDLKMHHVDLDKGIIYVKESRMLSSRHLQIVPNQYRILDRYANESRKELAVAPNDIFLLAKLGTPITVDDTHYLVSTFKTLFPERNLTPILIRQSVIANWLNEKKIPLEQVQLMAGHKWISTTIKYRHKDYEEERMLINKYFPLR
jgi:site-specific recombinase XerD